MDVEMFKGCDGSLTNDYERGYSAGYNAAEKHLRIKLDAAVELIERIERMLPESYDSAAWAMKAIKEWRGAQEG